MACVCYIYIYKLSVATSYGCLNALNIVCCIALLQVGCVRCNMRFFTVCDATATKAVI